jgi:predicted ABC-type ATPase
VPTLTIIAGPNGSGKSSTVAPLEIAGRENLLDPDAVARRLNPAMPTQAAVDAGREVLRRTQEYLATARDFAIETTLSGHQTFRAMREAKRRGLTVRLLYIALNTPEENVHRVQDRVIKGGHDVPDEDIRRRYYRSLANLPEAMRLADKATVYDNSGSEPIMVLEAHNGAITWRAEQMPAWAEEILRAFEPE